MAVAKAVTGWDRSAFAWVDIEDADGASHRYKKGRLAPDGGVVHVSYGLDASGTTQNLGLVRGTDRQSVLRQDGPGLPDRIVVEYNELTPTRGSVSPQGWEARYEYDHE
jgi:hypothetical protein